MIDFLCLDSGRDTPMHELVTVSSSLTFAAAESDGVVSTATDDAGVARQLCDGREPVVDMTTGRAYSDRL